MTIGAANGITIIIPLNFFLKRGKEENGSQPNNILIRPEHRLGESAKKIAKECRQVK